MTIRRIPGIVVVAFGLAGCASQSAINRQYKEMRPSIAAGRWDDAAEQLRAAQNDVYKEQDRVMYWLNLGTILHYAGDTAGSMENFIKAEETMQELWTKSVSGEIARFVLNETTQAYPGEDHERVLIYFYTAMNRLAQGRLTDALVEARRADEQLKRMRVAYEQKKGLGTVYVQDAFMLWMVGLFYEIEGSYNDAYLAYRQSQRVYAEEYRRKFGAVAPTFLAEDMFRSATLAGLEPEARALREGGEASGFSIDRLDQGWSELILVHGSGEAPYKEEEMVEAVVPGVNPYYVRIALPNFVSVPSKVYYARIQVTEYSAQTQLLEPVTRIAKAQHEAQEPAIKARAVARAAVKYAATQGAAAAVRGGKDSSTERQLAGALVSLIGNIAAAATEAADLRTWTTLPSEFGVARLWVPPGEHSYRVTFHGRGGTPVGKPVTKVVTLVPGERRIVSLRTIY